MIRFPTAVFLRLLAAACGAAVAEVLVDFIDCVIVGRVLGETALAGLELFLPVIGGVTALSLLAAGGTAILHAEAMGRFDRARADGAFSTGVFVSLALGLAAATALGFGLDAYLGFLGADAQTLGFARAYGRAYVPVVLLLPLMHMLITMVLADGGDKTFTASAAAVFVVNVGTSWFLAQAFGIAGCAWGTLAAVVVAIACLLFHFRAKGCSLAFRFRFSAVQARRILVANPGDALSELADAVALLFANWFVVRRCGSAARPVVALVFAVDGLMFVFNGFSNAAQSIV